MSYSGNTPSLFCWNEGVWFHPKMNPEESIKRAKFLVLAPAYSVIEDLNDGAFESIKGIHFERQLNPDEK